MTIEINPNNGMNLQPQAGNVGDVDPQQENSIFARFNDTDNKVDIKDVEYLNDAKPSAAITKFLETHLNQEWTSVLKEQINQLIARFNLENEGNNLLKQDFRADFNNFRKSAYDEFNSFKKDSQSKVLDFRKEVKEETDEFKRECIDEVLSDLKNGYSGFIKFDRIGTIVYDKEQKGFVLTNAKGNVLMDDNQLEKIINLAIEHGVNFRGESIKRE